jgi:hypothetical protein
MKTQGLQVFVRGLVAAYLLIMLPCTALAQMDHFKFIEQETVKCSALLTIMTAVDVPPESIRKLHRLDAEHQQDLLNDPEDFRLGAETYFRQAQFMGDVFGYIRSEYMPVTKSQLYQAKEKYFTNYENAMKTDPDWHAEVIRDHLVCQRYLNNFYENIEKAPNDLIGVARASVYQTQNEELEIEHISGYFYLTLIAFNHWEVIGFPTRRKLLDQIKESQPLPR